MMLLWIAVEILCKVGKKYPDKIRVFYNDANLGQGASRNIGLKYAKGEYVSFVDSDDFIHPDMYFDMYNDALLNGMPNIVTSRIVFAKEDATYQDYFKTNRRKGVLVDLKKSLIQLFMSLLLVEISYLNALLLKIRLFN